MELGGPQVVVAAHAPRPSGGASLPSIACRFLAFVFSAAGVC